MLREALRVLKPGGRFAVSDVVTRGALQEDIRKNMLLWVGCIAGALEESGYTAKLGGAGFREIAIEPTRVYNIEDARTFLSGQGIDVDAISPQVENKFISAFSRGEARVKGVLLPSATVVGQALVQVVRDGQPGNTVSVTVAVLAPMTVAVTDAAYNRVTADHPVKAGNPLLLCGDGGDESGGPDGQPAPSVPLAQLPYAVEALFFDDGGGISKAIFAGLSPGSVGLFQVIVQVPSDYPSGQVLVMLEFPNQTPMYSSVVGFWVQ